MNPKNISRNSLNIHYVNLFDSATPYQAHIWWMMLCIFTVIAVDDVGGRSGGGDAVGILYSREMLRFREF